MNRHGTVMVTARHGAELTTFFGPITARDITAQPRHGAESITIFEPIIARDITAHQ